MVNKVTFFLENCLAENTVKEVKKLMVVLLGICFKLFFLFNDPLLGFIFKFIEYSSLRISISTFPLHDLSQCCRVVVLSDQLHKCPEWILAVFFLVLDPHKQVHVLIQIIPE